MARGMQDIKALFVVHVQNTKKKITYPQRICGTHVSSKCRAKCRTSGVFLSYTYKSRKTHLHIFATHMYVARTFRAMARGMQDMKALFKVRIESTKKTIDTYSQHICIWHVEQMARGMPDIKALLEVRNM